MRGMPDNKLGLVCSPGCTSFFFFLHRFYFHLSQHDLLTERTRYTSNIREFVAVPMFNSAVLFSRKHKSQ